MCHGAREAKLTKVPNNYCQCHPLCFSCGSANVQALLRSAHVAANGISGTIVLCRESGTAQRATRCSRINILQYFKHCLLRCFKGTLKQSSKHCLITSSGFMLNVHTPPWEFSQITYIHSVMGELCSEVLAPLLLAELPTSAAMPASRAEHNGFWAHVFPYKTLWTNVSKHDVDTGR